MNDATCLVDIARHFSVLQDLAPVKVSFEEGRVAAEAMNGKTDLRIQAAAEISGRTEGLTTVACYGKFDFHVSALASTVYICLPQILRGFADIHPGVVPQVTRAPDGYGGSWLEVEFRGLAGDNAYAKLQSASYAGCVVKVPPLRPQPPDVSFMPSAKAVNLFKTLAIQAKKVGIDRFWAIMNKRGRLYFSFDINPIGSQPALFEVASGLPYCQLLPYSYDATAVLKVLALADHDRPVVMSFLGAGGLTLDFVSALGGSYRYFFVGSKELFSESQRDLDWVSQPARMYAEDACSHVDWEPDL